VRLGLVTHAADTQIVEWTDGLKFKLYRGWLILTITSGQLPEDYSTDVLNIEQ
jgi:hypothetical protein